jgi:hypothetical protein
MFARQPADVPPTKLPMNSVKVNTIVVAFILLELVVCQLQLMTTLYDPATPTQLSIDRTSLDVVVTNIQKWTLFRMSLFWISASLRIVFVLECTLRLLLSLKTLDFVTILDFAVSVSCLVLKFTINSRDNLVVNFLILLRLVRLWLLMDQFYSKIEDEAEKRQMATERHCQDMLRHSEVQMEKLVRKLDTAENKLRVMMGYIVVT